VHGEERRDLVRQRRQAHTDALGYREHKLKKNRKNRQKNGMVTMAKVSKENGEDETEGEGTREGGEIADRHRYSSSIPAPGQGYR